MCPTNANMFIFIIAIEGRDLFPYFHSTNGETVAGMHSSQLALLFKGSMMYAMDSVLNLLVAILEKQKKEMKLTLIFFKKLTK